MKIRGNNFWQKEFETNNFRQAKTLSFSRETGETTKKNETKICSFRSKIKYKRRWIKPWKKEYLRIKLQKVHNNCLKTNLFVLPNNFHFCMLLYRTLFCSFVNVFCLFVIFFLCVKLFIYTSFNFQFVCKNVLMKPDLPLSYNILLQSGFFFLSYSKVH